MARRMPRRKASSRGTQAAAICWHLCAGRQGMYEWIGTVHPCSGGWGYRHPPCLDAVSGRAKGRPGYAGPGGDLWHSG